MADEEKGRVMGHGPCPNCGHDAAYKVNKKNHLYVYCTVEVDGGCHTGSQSRSASGDRHLAKRITKWTKAEDRKKYLGEDAAPAGQPKKSIWDMEIKL